MSDLVKTLKKVLLTIFLAWSAMNSSAQDNVSSGEAVVNKAMRDPTRPLTYRAPAVVKEALSLNSILIAQGRKVAVINGLQYVENESSAELRVIRIDQDKVVVNHKGQQKTLILHQSIRQ